MGILLCTTEIFPLAKILHFPHLSMKVFSTSASCYCTQQIEPTVQINQVLRNVLALSKERNNGVCILNLLNLQVRGKRCLVQKTSQTVGFTDEPSAAARLCSDSQLKQSQLYEPVK